MFNINGIDFASMVCLESIFPNPTRLFVNKGAKFLVYIVNDGWYTKPPEPQQHAKRCIYRAIENRRYVLRSANSGVSTIINEVGEYEGHLPFDERGSISGKAFTIEEKTFYNKNGDYIARICILISILLLLISFSKVKD